MKEVTDLMADYLNFCSLRKRLDSKSIRAYKGDLRQFCGYLQESGEDFLNKKCLGNYIERLHQSFSPRTVKRKIASLQAFYHYLIYEELIGDNPFQKLDVSFKLPQQLPRYIPMHIIKSFYSVLYAQKEHVATLYQKKCAVRNIAVIELLFSTGLRISELCRLPQSHVNLVDRDVLIQGKGNKERLIQLTDIHTVKALEEYHTIFSAEIKRCGYFFVNSWGNPLSDQSVRNMIRKLAGQASLNLHITPHMFRHSFATFLVNQDVDIRCIQEILGHSSIKTTEIYTHVSAEKQKRILLEKNPRKLI